MSIFCLFHRQQELKAAHTGTPAFPFSIAASAASGRRPSGPTPWRQILSSPAVWAVLAGHVSSNWGMYQLLTMMPTYLDNVLRFNIKTSGFVLMIPYLAQTLVCLFGGWLTDLLRARTRMRTVTVRKVNTAVGLLVPAVTLVLAGYSGCDAALAVAFFMLSVGFNTFTVSGCKTSMMDFAPAYSGIIMGISNMAANFTG